MDDPNQPLLHADDMLPPPSERIPVLRWMKQNLFSTWYNVVLSVVVTAIIVVVVSGLMRWALTTAEWEVIPANIKGLLVGTYAWDSLWRVWSTLYMIVSLIGFSAGIHKGLYRTAALAVSLAAMVVAVITALLMAFAPFELPEFYHQGLIEQILGVVLFVVVGFGIGFLGRRSKITRRLELIFWILSLPALIVILIGVNPMLMDQTARVGSIINLIFLIGGVSAMLHGGWVRKLSIVVVVVGWAAALVLQFVTMAPAPLSPINWIFSATAFFLVGMGLGYLGRNLLTRAWELALWLALIPATALLWVGGVEAAWNQWMFGIFPRVGDWNKWGFLLNLLGALVGIALSIPIGIMLALGRRSQLPAIRIVCTGYIELIRGVPLISLLFMASNMLPLLIPGTFRPDIVVRAMVTITAFSAAYMAENVRGGLQSISRGQTEAAYAVGLNGTLTTLFIVLPQALRNVIPAIVGQAISLFKDTSLFGFIAIIEVVAVSRSIYGGLEWRGTIFELFAFLGFIFWIFCYSMSYISRRIERHLGVGQR